MSQVTVSEATLKRVRDYAVEEPGFTCAFAAWDLSRTGGTITATTVKNCVTELLRLGIVALVEDHGTRGRVYAYAPVPTMTTRRFTELDESRRIGIGAEAPARGEVVPHTRPRGPSGKPGHDRERQERGVRIKRARQGT